MPRLAPPPATDCKQAQRRMLLRLDGAVVLAGGLALVALQRPLHDLLGWPSTGTLALLGVAWLAWGGALLTVAQRRSVSRGLTLGVALANSLWFDASIVAAALAPPGLTAAGRAVILAAAFIAMLFAVAQVLAVRER